MPSIVLSGAGQTKNMCPVNLSADSARDRPDRRGLALASRLLTWIPIMSLQAPRRGSHHAEILIGRSLAAAVHPVAAWRSAVPSFRLLLLASYFLVGYTIALGALILL